MRKFKFLALAFAAFSFAACSDDAIEGQSGSGGSLEEASPAVLQRMTRIITGMNILRMILLREKIVDTIMMVQKQNGL